MGRNGQTVVLVLVAFVGGGLLAGTALFAIDDGSSDDEPITFEGTGAGVTTFDSETEYRSYRQRGQSQSQPGWFGIARPQVAMGGQAARTDVVEQAGDDAAASGAPDRGGAGSGSPDRYSKTNVQVRGVQEPDILKTDGTHVYYAGFDGRPRRDGTGGHVFNATDPAAPTLSGRIPEGGTYFQTGEMLVAITQDAVYGFDVSDPADPVEQWEKPLNHRYETARLIDGTIYLVTADRPQEYACPVEPMARGGPEIDCTEIYRPASGQGGDTTYTALSIDPQSGDVGESVSFVGSGENTVVSVTHDAIYLSYEQSQSRAATRLAYFLSPGSKYLDDAALQRLREIDSYDLSPQAAQLEIRTTVQAALQRRSDTEPKQQRQELRSDYEQFVEQHKRELIKTGIVRIGLDGDTLAVEASGTVPGRLLNQFSMGAQDGYLQVATTTNPGGAEWENDLYTLDEDLEIADSITGMGTEQRIYSVRYVDDRAYIVTFRQVDPFYVIDTSNPTELELQGELKLPGYSGYMHSLGDDRILGIGEEDGRVKATIFDASDPENPVVEDDVVLDDYWSAVSESHHAFLLDEQNEVFFLPGSEGGHIYSYSDGLERVKTVETDGPAVRALYIDQYMYVFGTQDVVVVDQRDYSVVERQSIEQSVPADASN